MEHVVSPAGAEKKLLREAIEQETQQFLNQGGKITVLNSHLVEADFRRSPWREDGDDLMAGQ
jgi:hypothetical protein